MPINLTAGRPVLAQTSSLPVVLIPEAPIESDGDDTITFRVSRENVNPPNFSITGVATTSGSPTISKASLAGLRVGDSVSSANITGTVTAVNLTASPNTATISTNASATGSVSITVDPPEYDVALYDIVVKHAASAGSPNLQVTIDVYQYSGEGSLNASGKDAVTPSSGVRVGSVSLISSLDQILSAIRVPRT